MDFLLATHDWKNFLCNLPSGRVETEFQHLKIKFEGASEALLKEQEAVSRTIVEARPSSHSLFSNCRVADLGLAQHTRNLIDLKRILEVLMEEI